MVITVGCRDEHVRAGATHLAREASHHLERFFHHILEIDWHVVHIRHEFTVTCTAHTPNGHFHAEASAATLALAIAEAARVIESQRRRAKRRALGGRHSSPNLAAAR